MLKDVTRLDIALGYMLRLGKLDLINLLDGSDTQINTRRINNTGVDPSITNQFATRLDINTSSHPGHQRTRTRRRTGLLSLRPFVNDIRRRFVAR